MAEVAGRGRVAAFPATVRRCARLLLVAGALARVATPAHAQGDVPQRGLVYAPLGSDPAGDTIAPPLPREFRAVWVATVTNIDWPSRKGLPPIEQQQEFVNILDNHQRLGINAVFVQVRAASTWSR